MNDSFELFIIHIYSNDSVTKKKIIILRLYVISRSLVQTYGFKS